MRTRKELKEEYKQITPIAGVFQIKNLESGMILLEDSLNIESKWNRHRTELSFGSHRNKRLQSDWNSSGKDNFVLTILSELDTKEGVNIDWNKEIKELRKMVEEELNIPSEMKY